MKMKKIDCLLEKIKESYIEILNENLVGIYVHGSIAFGCFNFEKSDIDFLVVVSDKISTDVKLKLLEVLDKLRPEAPRKGFEMSVVLEQYCLNFVYPTPFELHFSNAWLDRYLQNPLILCNDKEKVDWDLAAHFKVIKEVGIKLYGEEIEDVFGDIEEKYYIDSILDDVKKPLEKFDSNPVYIVLNLCRVLAYLKDKLVLSKDAAGKWALENVCSLYQETIRDALKAYKSKDILIEKNKGRSFCTYMEEEIGKYR